MRALVPVALVAAFVLPAAATAADREITLASEGAKETWTSPVKTGAVYTSDVSSRVPACSQIFSCDSTLVRTEQYGDLLVDIVGNDQQGQDTLQDLDVHVYVSNEDGAMGDVLAEGTTAEQSESVSIPDVPAGYYLVYVDWYFGYGNYDGTATLAAPSTPLEEGQEPPAFVPAENNYPKVTPSRTHAFAGTAPFAWDSLPGGGLADVQPQVGCRGANCDYSLFQVSETGLMTVTTTGDAPTLVDADIHVYESDAEGSVGPEVGSATNFTPNETAQILVEPGHYLMMVAFSGAGTYSGTAQWEPLPPEEEF